jgi:prolyl 4-hydroxylase
MENVRSERYDYKRSGVSLRPRELNERLRVLKYTSEPGNPNYFKAHFDGSYPRPSNHPHYPDVSKFTVLIYLNGGIEGGCTRVFNGDKFYDCDPSTGRVLIHDHAILHEGTPVVEGTGTKYVIRTDIMCTIIPDDSH